MIKDKEIKRLLKFAKETALGAGKILAQKAHRYNEIYFKGAVNLVTAADLASEKFIINNIEKNYPGYSLLTEEKHPSNKDSEFRWVVDPLDGTTNYAHHFPFYCVSIALEYQGEIILGTVYNPERDEIFYACRGGGAFLNRKRIAVTNEHELVNSLLATGFPYDIGVSQEDNLKNYVKFAKVSRGIRRAGSAALDLCYVACGGFDGFWELKLSPWDTAAGKIIVEEAGGRISDFKGKDYSIYGKYILASNGHIHGQMMKILSGTRRK